ncbi:MAG: CHAT domain-containing protein [Blastocatellia bacterium]
MNNIRVLIVEDEPNWQLELSTILHRMDGSIKAESIDHFDAAARKIRSDKYDLAVVDVLLPGGPPQAGVELLRQLRGGSLNQYCGVILLTAHATPKIVSDAMANDRATCVLEKQGADGMGFDPDEFIRKVREALLNSRLRRAEALRNSYFRLTLTLTERGLAGSELAGPMVKSQYAFDPAVRFDGTDLARRADDLNQRLFEGDKGAWRSEAVSLGKTIYQSLAGHQETNTCLTEAKTHARPADRLWIQLVGPPSNLSYPFELMHDGGDYLAFANIITRKILQGGSARTRKGEPFHQFISALAARGETLKALVVGYGGEGDPINAESEASSLTRSIESSARLLGMDCAVQLLARKEATFDAVREALRSGCHIFHYAGHGEFDDNLPESSPLILPDRDLTASDLNLLTLDTELRLVFLNCCLGARTASQVGRGDFHGFLHALSQADVPIVLAHRWEVGGASSRLLAEEFYQHLWRGFCPEMALLEARRRIALEAGGRNDSAWAAPVLVMQNN